MASLNIDDFEGVHPDEDTGLLYTNMKGGRRVLLCSLCHFLSAEEPKTSMCKSYTTLIADADAFTNSVRKAGFSDFYLETITDKYGDQWPVVGRRTALLYFKEVPLRQLSEQYSQLCSVLNDDLENAPKQFALALRVGVWCFGNVNSGPGVHLILLVALQCEFDAANIHKVCPEFFSHIVPATATSRKNRPHRLVSFPSKMYADPLHRRRYDQAVKRWESSNAGQSLCCEAAKCCMPLTCADKERLLLQNQARLYSVQSPLQERATQTSSGCALSKTVTNTFPGLA